MKKPIIIGIAGGSASGKTTIAKYIYETFQKTNSIAIIREDDYYKDQSDIPFEERVKVNYDHPDSLETDLLVRHLRELKHGRPVQCPVYDYTVHNRSDKTTAALPNKVILVEGILVLQDERLRDMMDIKIYVDTDADIRLCRRIKRDVNKRGRTLESVLTQYQTTVKPMHEKYVEPSKRYADLVVPEGGKNMIALDMILGRIQRHLDKTDN